MLRKTLFNKTSLFSYGLLTRHTIDVLVTVGSHAENGLRKREFMWSHRKFSIHISRVSGTIRFRMWKSKERATGYSREQLISGTWAQERCRDTDSVMLTTSKRRAVKSRAYKNTKLSCDKSQFSCSVITIRFTCDT